MAGTKAATLMTASERLSRILNKRGRKPRAAAKCQHRCLISRVLLFPDNSFGEFRQDSG